jgi:Co/Zn/Cd efflux system component
MANPLLSLFVSALIFRAAWTLTRELVNVLLESVPKGFDITRVEKELMDHLPRSDRRG